jgi:hypothetical protein
MPRIGGEAIPARNFGPLIIPTGALRFETAECQLCGSMSSLRGGSIEKLRLSVVRRHTKAAPPTNPEVILCIKVVLRRSAPA